MKHLLQKHHRLLYGLAAFLALLLAAQTAAAQQDPAAIREALEAQHPHRPVDPQPQVNYASSSTLGKSASGTTIRSTSTGGHWDADTTWQGGVVPTAEDTVVITTDAAVHLDVDGQRSCAYLTVEESAVLVGYRDALLGAKSGVTNRGTIKNDTTAAYDSDYFFILGTQGPFHNEGVIQGSQNDVWQIMEFELYSNVHNTGTWGYSLVEIFGAGRRTLDFGDVQGPIVSIYGHPVTLLGENRLPLFFMEGPGVMIVDNEASLRLTGNLANFQFYTSEINGQFLNHGRIVSSIGSVTGSAYDAAASWSSEGDSAHVLSYGTQVPASFGNAVRRWWRVEPVEGSEGARFDYMTFQFTVQDLGLNDPDSLHLYHSADGGQSWGRVSDENNITRSLLFLEEWGLGSISVSDDLPASGDYALADTPPAATRPTAVLRIIGRNQIRIGGPPARYTVYYANVGDVPVGEGLVGLQTDGGVYIDSIVPSRPDTSRPMPQPWDKNVFSLYDDSTSAVLVTSDLAPGESRTFTMYLKAIPTDDDPGGGVASLRAAAAPAVLGGIAVGVGLGYLKDLATNSLEEVMSDPCGDFVGAGGAIDRAFDKTDEQWNPFGDSEKPWLAVAENGASAMTDNGLVKNSLGRVNVVNDLKSVGDAVANASDRYEQKYGPGSIYQPIDCDPDDDPPPFPRPNRIPDLKPLTPVRSWDPNAKVGPEGVGDEGFISSGGRFTYQILFENKAEATAPAYTVTIVDTLSDVYDWSSVERIGESHEGFTFTQTEDSILTWDIVGIELPPNENPPEGEGYVEFSIATRDSLSSETVIANKASITFDLNKPIVTNTHVNTLDLDRPVTTMEALPETVSGDSVEVRWSVDDGNGSGIGSVAVYASRDGGPFHQAGVSEGTSLMVGVQPGHSYEFYALAQDRVGNAELTRPALTTTQVLEPTSTEDETPFAFALHENYPNPFNPSTTLRFTLPESAPARLVVYDVLGRHVATLVDGPMAAGAHRVEWEAQGMGSGVYFYRLTQGDHHTTRSMVLLK